MRYQVEFMQGAREEEIVPFPERGGNGDKTRHQAEKE